MSFLHFLIGQNIWPCPNKQQQQQHQKKRLSESELTAEQRQRAGLARGGLLIIIQLACIHIHASQILTCELCT